MDHGKRFYRYRGVNLDLILGVEYGSGISISVEVLDKQGKLMEFKEFTFNEQVVNSWLRQMTRRAIRSVLHL